MLYLISHGDLLGLADGTSKVGADRQKVSNTDEHIESLQKQTASYAETEHSESKK